MKEVKKKENLEEIAIQIEAHAKMAVEEMLIVGKLLNEAREKFTSDNKFGTWRKERLPWLNQKIANRYINVYRNNGVKLLTARHNVSPTILYELTAPSTPESARQEAIETEGKLTIKQTKEIIEANKLIEKLKKENEQLKISREPNIDNLIPELMKLYKGGSLIPARANQLSILTSEQQRIYYQDFEQKEEFKRQADAEREKAIKAFEQALQAIKEKENALAKLEEAAGTTEAELLLKQEKERKRLAEEYQEKLILERKKARKEASEIFEKLNKDKITEAIKAKELAEKRAKEAIEKRNAAYAEQKKLSIKLKEYEEVVEAKKPADFDRGRNERLMLIIQELAEHIEFIETDISQIGVEQMPKTIETLKKLETFIHDRIKVIESAKNSIIEIN